ncbi:hypothetical protein [Pseudogracilibacillus sp. SO30301A]|uniref:hypothetical protein n=1 Tax=Pseudogracilibacillus sp. SO30301A TaxID=3098291 RepID=UPI00300E0908
MNSYKWKIGESILDSAFDAYPIYEMLEHYDVSAIIDLNPRGSKQFIYNEMDINLDGVPLCPLVVKWLTGAWIKNVTVANGVALQPLENGIPKPVFRFKLRETFYTSTKDNPRLFPRIKNVIVRNGTSAIPFALALNIVSNVKKLIMT